MAANMCGVIFDLKSDTFKDILEIPRGFFNSSSNLLHRSANNFSTDYF